VIHVEVMDHRGQSVRLSNDLSLALVDLTHAVRQLQPSDRGKNKRDEAVLDAARRLNAMLQGEGNATSR
jgi:hypothetical protein